MSTIIRNVKIRYDKHRVRLNSGEYCRKDGRYCFSWTGTDRKRHYVYASSLDELRKLEAQIQKDRDDGIREEMRDATINEVFELWKETKRGLRDRTKTSYVYFYDLFVRPVFGQKKIQRVKRTDVRAFYNNLIEVRGLKSSTLENVHTVLHQVFQLAVEDDIIRANPSDLLIREIKRAFGGDSEPKRALTRDQERLFFKVVKETPQYRKWYPILYIMANTGMRVGEISGLRWCDVNFEKNIISVNHTLVYYDHQNDKGCYYNMHKPKTLAGERTIPLTPSVKSAFMMQKEYLELTGLKSVDHIDGYDDFIFINRYGKVFNQSPINSAIHRIVKEINLDILEKAGENEPECLIPHFSCHILRHTFATRLCEQGVNIKVIQAVLGHKDFQTTMNIYVDVTNELKEDEMNKFDEYIHMDKEKLVVVKD